MQNFVMSISQLSHLFLECEELKTGYRSEFEEIMAPSRLCPVVTKCLLCVYLAVAVYSIPVQHISLNGIWQVTNANKSKNICFSLYFLQFVIIAEKVEPQRLVHCVVTSPRNAVDAVNYRASDPFVFALDVSTRSKLGCAKVIISYTCLCDCGCAELMNRVSFSVAGPRSWNNLPCAIRELDKCISVSS